MLFKLLVLLAPACSIIFKKFPSLLARNSFMIARQNGVVFDFIFSIITFTIANATLIIFSLVEALKP